MRFLFIGSRFTLRTSFPRSVTLTQLYFASLVVTNLRRDLHPQVCAHAGRTTKKPTKHRRLFNLVAREGFELRPLGYEPNELPDCSTAR